MPASRRLMAILLPVILAFIVTAGCDGPSDPEESGWRHEVDASIQSLEISSSYRYRIRLETWVGVYGQSVYGDENGEGTYSGGDFYVSILRNSPAGEEGLAFASQQEELFLQEGGAWRPISMEEVPSPLYDPVRFLRFVSAYGSISLEGEEDISGKMHRRYLLHLGGDSARDALSARAWSFFSSLAYELNCRVWIGDASTPPSSLRLEVSGFDPQESLQRYRIVATLEPYDIDSSDIQPIAPPITTE